MKNNQKGLWIVLIIILVILIIWGIVAAYNRSEVTPANQGLNATSSADVNGNQPGTNSGGTSGGVHGVSKKPAPIISSLSPGAGRAGVTITINGSGFTSANNSISFSGFVVSPTTVSNDGNHLSFIVPDSYRVCNGGTCSSTVVIVKAGSYPVAVSNTNGTSNIFNFIVTTGANGQ